MPSSAAQIAAKERELGRTLSPAEKLALKKTNPSVAIREETHALTRTYKGNNTAEKIAADSADLGKAAKTDAANLIEAGKKTGVDLTKAAKKVEEMTTSK